ncbi:reverse transcriptase domain-containing protein [Priestia megaterium]|uniref:RNA-directed DNA polymerase n=1 Tax=Priestia megaterium TaxID=1404 RepID=UPI00244667F0|nr:RNA-directed DNA polymerase [Priestia megaterium]WRQ94729.1 reverse transcriptase domain-containing protein [Priestia megaterium]
MELKEKLTIAWKRIKADRKTDFIIGDYEYIVYDRYHEEMIEELAQRVESAGAKYRPDSLRKIRVPKISHTTRPGALPTIPDRVLYQYLVDEIAEEIEKNLVPIVDKVVHSYRYSNDRRSVKMFRFDTASYNTYQERIQEMAEEHEYIVTTDISDYFERIYHHDLENALRGLGGNDNNITLLMSLLRKWQMGNSYSIPQGIWPSDYLGNIYLDPIDKFMIRSGFKYCRFVDDIRIGTDTYLDAEKALLELEEQLGRCGLTLNASKTRIIPSNKIEDELFPHKQRLQEISDSLCVSVNPYHETEDDEEPLERENHETQSIRQLFQEQLESSSPEPHIMRFCLKHFRKFLDEEILDFILENLSSLVVVTPQVVNYLITISEDVDLRDKIVREVSSFISRELTCYDWQLMWLLHCLDRIGYVSDEAVANIRKALDKSELHESVAVHLILLIGKHGDMEDRNQLLGRYDREHSLWIKRAILFAIKDITVTKRNHFYSYCKGNDFFTDKVIDYITSLQ